MNTLENNKLIAEFMEWIKGELYSEEQQFYCAWNEGDANQLLPKEMEFHTSWEWLMPVVEKIELMGYEVIMRKDTCEIIGDNYEETMDFDAGRHITTFSAVVEFIKWYNENK